MSVDIQHYKHEYSAHYAMFDILGTPAARTPCSRGQNPLYYNNMSHTQIYIFI